MKSLFLVLVDKLVVKCAGTILQDTMGYDMFKSVTTCCLKAFKLKHFANVEAEKKLGLGKVYGSKYRIWPDHEINTDKALSF